MQSRAPTDSWLPQPDVVWWSEENSEGTGACYWICIEKDTLNRVAVYSVVQGSDFFIPVLTLFISLLSIWVGLLNPT